MRSRAKTVHGRSAIEVRQRTLALHRRGGGPAANAVRRRAQSKPGKERWRPMVPVEVRQGALGAHGESRETRKAEADGRSNNLHWTCGPLACSFQIKTDICKKHVDKLSRSEHCCHSTLTNLVWEPIRTVRHQKFNCF